MPLPAQYRELAPVSRGVEAVWTYEVDATAREPVSHIVLPDGCMDLIFRQEAPCSGGVCRVLIAGPSCSPRSIVIASGTRFAGVRFNPAWGAASLRRDAQNLVDQVIPAADAEKLLANESSRLANEELAEVAAYLSRRAEELVAAARPDPRATEAVRWLQTSGGRMSPREVARLLGVPGRTLRRVVAHAVGLPPGRLVRVFRFRRCLLLRKADASLSLAALAHESGYADQAHMTREFQLLGGFSPARFPRLLVS
jgi:AraC-like DNA-binding protein